MANGNRNQSVVAEMIAVPLIWIAVLVALCLVAWIGFRAVTALGIFAAYDLAGVVVHEDGSPFGDVTVSITAGHTKNMGTATDYDYWSEQVSGQFHVRVSTASTVRLQFLKTGYERQTLDFTSSAKRRGLRVVMRPKRAPAGTTVPTAVRDRSAG